MLRASPDRTGPDRLEVLGRRVRQEVFEVVEDGQEAMDRQGLAGVVYASASRSINAL